MIRMAVGKVQAVRTVWTRWFQGSGRYRPSPEVRMGCELNRLARRSQPPRVIRMERASA